MDILRLNSVTYAPDALLEGYSSCVWTERYSQSGDFEVKTAKVAETIDLLPIGSLVSVRDQNETMMVETHSIDRNSEGYPELTITGSSFDTFFKNRVLTALVYNTPWQVFRTYTPSEFVSLIMWNSGVNTTGEDPTRAATTNQAKDGIPLVVVTDSTTRVDTNKVWWQESGIVYDQLRDILVLVDLGIRTLRPQNSTGYVMTYDVTRTATRGTVSKTLTSDISQLRLDVFNGVDRTRNQTAVPTVAFRYDSGDIENPKYLFSNKEYKNFATVVGSKGTNDIWPDTTPAPDTTIAGLARRPLFVDGGEVDAAMTAPDYLAAMTQKGRLELKKYNQLSVFDGAISPLSQYKYNTDYGLGDRVTLMAEYDFEASMIVSEYVRTEDQSGDRGYPGLSTIS